MILDEPNQTKQNDINKYVDKINKRKISYDNNDSNDEKDTYAKIKNCCAVKKYCAFYLSTNFR